MNGVVAQANRLVAALTGEHDDVLLQVGRFDLLENHRLTRLSEVERQPMTLRTTNRRVVGSQRFLVHQVLKGLLKGGAVHGGDGPQQCHPRQGPNRSRVCLLLLALTFSACVSRDTRIGRRAMARGDYQEAAEAYERAALASPLEPAKWQALARAHLMADDPAAARIAFVRMAALLPTDPHPIVEIGFTLELQRRYDEALLRYQEAVTRAPESAYPYRVLGTRLLRWGRPEEAELPLRRAVALDEGHAETHKALALSLALRSEWDEAEVAYRAGLEAHPGDIPLRLGLAALLINTEQYEEALSIYEWICEVAPGFAAAHAGRGILLHELGRPDEAEEAFLEAVRFDDDEGSYAARLEAYRTLRREEASSPPETTPSAR